MNKDLQQKSFAAKAKDEIFLISADLPTCCYHAMSYGLLLCGWSFGLSSMMLVTEHEGTALLYSQAVGSITGKAPEVRQSESGKFSVSVSRKEDRLKVLASFGISEKTVGVRINRANISDECCHAAFVRGAFLACATVTSPEKSYQLEFLLPYLHLADDMLNL
ncbi:MAG: DNA-binding protein WhiA, partial [Clostridia bacterium]|nr:DNA-binding protein WhiA [Clostridia bacterium]